MFRWWNLPFFWQEQIPKLAITSHDTIDYLILLRYPSHLRTLTLDLENLDHEGGDAVVFGIGHLFVQCK